ncbi:MAG: hypothetical protein JWP59_3123 [Massilia sp.]|nr:hypothetical protein [Massilia sp.]
MPKRLALAAVLLALACQAGAAEFPDYPFIHTSGTGFTYVAPDLGEIDFEVSLFDADPELARRNLEARIAAIRAVLEGAAVRAADIDIRDVRRDIRKGAPAGVPEYDLKCGVHIRIADLSKWKTVVGALIAMPDLDGFLIGFDSSRREQIEGELTAEALKNARRRAEAIAGGVGRKLGLASAVSTGDLKNVTRAVGLGGAQSVGYRNPVKADPDREGLLMIVPMKLSQSVDVIYRFK